MGFHNNVLSGSAGQQGYQISRSVRLRRSASAYFNRTFGTPTNANIWSLSGWAKRGLLGTQISLFGASVTSYTSVTFLSGDTLRINLGNGTNGQLVTTQVFRDPSAYYHIAIAYDSTQATASNRIKLYINGVQVTSFSTANYPAQNVSAEWNYAGAVGTIGTASTEYWDGYLTEVNFIDGQALTPSSFGETDAITGVWKPKKYAGTYGTNGFYLNFSDNSNNTAATIGKDYSGNGNNWTPNNISVTAGVTYDSMLDTPTPYADGGNGRGNYCVLNPLDSVSGTAAISEANLRVTGPSAGWRSSTFLQTTGKWYYEANIGQVSSGIQNDAVGLSIIPNTSAYLRAYAPNGNYYNGSSWATYGATYASGDVIGIAFDLDNQTLEFFKNGVSQGQKTSIGLTGVFVCPQVAVTGASGNTIAMNFGQRPFAYTPPTGFKALNTQNLPDSLIVKGSTAFNISLDTGANIKTSTEALFGTSYLEWIKDRATANNHQLIDTVRGTSAVLQSNTTAAETTYTAPGGNSVGWAWKKGATQGFDIVTYTGTGVATTVAHSLGVAPKMIIAKSRSSGTAGWPVYHASIGAANYLALNTTAASAAGAVWNSTTPTSSVFSVGATGNGINDSGATYVAYLFAEVAGYSKFGSYTGNGSADGPFVYCGFRPRFIMVKVTSAPDGWIMYDTARNTYNVVNSSLYANNSNTEATEANNPFDVLSNGFKLRGAGSTTNASGGTYIFAAFATNPFKNSLAA